MSSKSKSAKPATSPTTHARDLAAKPSPAAPKPTRAASTKEVKPTSSLKLPARAPTRTKPSSGKLSALDAAARVLQGLPAKEAATGISTPTLIERMAEARLWTSPGGKTPAATLYAAIVREIGKKDGPCRFRRVSPGHFALAASAASAATKRSTRTAQHASKADAPASGKSGVRQPTSKAGKA